MTSETQQALRRLPSVDALMQSLISTGGGGIATDALVSLARATLDSARAAVLDGRLDSPEAVAGELVAAVAELTSAIPQTVINGTGVIIHTNLGRSPISNATARAMAVSGSNYLPLEVDLESARRGGRGETIAKQLRILTGAESAIAVNNNAAAVLLTLSALCSGREVIVSRGEAVEIGGGFRIPDVMRQSGAQIVEVGTTNRTTAEDYQQVITEHTAAILSVHASNFEISGFTSKPSLVELASVAHANGLLLIEDVGSGCLISTEPYGIEHEPTLGESIDAGVDVVTASGDKLLGGPQAGLILGRRASLEKIRSFPLARAVRTDKTILAGLTATLAHYVRGDYENEVPVWWMMSRTDEWLRNRCQRWLTSLDEFNCTMIETVSVVGGGSLPGKSQKSYGIAISPPAGRPSDFARRLRTSDQPVFPRIEDDLVVVDARTVLNEQDDVLLNSLSTVLAAS